MGDKTGPGLSKVEGIKLSPSERTALYGARRFIGSALEEKLRLRIPFDVYFQDPLVAASNPEAGVRRRLPRPVGAGARATVRRARGSPSSTTTRTPRR